MGEEQWRCPNCGDVMPPGYGEDDHFSCNWPDEFEGYDK